MAGLQGVGKTTACGKMALYLKKQKKRVLMVATDVYRPAAIEQLVKLGDRISVSVFQQGTDAKPQDIAAAGLKHVSHAVSSTLHDLNLSDARAQADQDILVNIALRRLSSIIPLHQMCSQTAHSVIAIIIAVSIVIIIAF